MRLNMATKKERITERDNVLLECGHVSFGYGLLKVLGKIGKLYTECPKGCNGDGPGNLVLVKRKAKGGDYESAPSGLDKRSPGQLF
jgi:hypothetical protein